MVDLAQRGCRCASSRTCAIARFGPVERWIRRSVRSQDWRVAPPSPRTHHRFARKSFRSLFMAIETLAAAFRWIMQVHLAIAGG